MIDVGKTQVVARHGDPADVICAKEPFLMTQARSHLLCFSWIDQRPLWDIPELLKTKKNLIQSFMALIYK